MMVNSRLSASCFEIGAAPRAYEEDVSYIDEFDDITDDVSTADMSSAISQRSSVVTADSGRASSSSTYKSPEKDEKKKKSKKMVVCRVALLDGTTFEPKGIDKNSDGQVVFEKVTKHLDVIETDYFGLTYRDKSGKKFWLDNTKKISKQVKGGTWVFEFQVKFYPPDPMSLKEDVTRYQLCLQVRVDLFNGRLPCSFATYALLGSYTVQAELGDWEHKEYGDSTTYLNEFDFAPGQNQELLEKIAELHKNHKGQAPSMAEAHFLENAKKLAMYGVDMHDVKDFENKRLTLGICANGILVYKDRLRVSRFVWPKILKLSYKRDSFYVKIRPGEFEPHERTISFRCDSHKLAKRLWKTCVEHHAFFRLKTSDPPNSDTLFPRFNTRFRYSGRTAAQARKAAEMTDREEPHIARTAERRSMHDKTKSLDNMQTQKKPYDENDIHDNKSGDPDATYDKDGNNMTDLYAQVNKKPPNGEDAADRLDNRPGEEPGTEGPPGYSADVSALSDGGKKSKKEKEEEKKRKKEEERRKKEEEKERKRLEKELEKQKKKKDKEKEKKRSSGGLFGLLRRSQKDKSEDENKDKKLDEKTEQLKEDFMQLLRETPDITSTTRLSDVEHKIDSDPRYQAVDADARQRWFNEYVDDMLKSDFMRLLRDTPSIDSQTTWPEARQEIDNDPRFHAVGTEEQREQWFNEYIQSLGHIDFEAYKLDNRLAKLKSDYMQLLKDTPMVTSDSRFDEVKVYIENDPRYQAVPSDKQREDWYNEYVNNLKKEEFIQLLYDTPSVTSYSKYPDVREDICHDPRFENVDSEEKREQYFNEHTTNLKKASYVQLLQDTPDITGYSEWHQSKHLIDTDPRYHAVESDLLRTKWFNEYVNNLAGRNYGDVDYGLKIGGYKSIDRKLEFLPISPPTLTTKKSQDDRMPFFEPAGDTDVDSLGRKKVPPPIAKKPRGSVGYESEEDRLLNSQTGVPVTVRTESYKYSPDINDVPRPTSNIPIVETKTHKVTYEKDGVPYEMEESILVSAHSVTTKSQTIDTTTYKTERDGVIETRVERKITVTSDENDDLDHDALLRAAIEEVTNMNPDMSVEKIECVRQIEEINGN
ncbi:hypothetical protein ACF0H5_004362 [Mactra antiquata]